ncbi:hypothetical protein N7471_013449 [Penicillium samsonianum]|uniref:uncharacterized protein n=1 Tax=Penicillium samsonianum TaxID=1882272 RepID=UPI002548E93D|nr:uncharacterized protein N7471_013449 [Penicillium samsonianum]KAJ6118829.1 hypothetical protein N7471_013449 [Penicillium samsonianum]
MNAPDSDGIIQKDLDCHEQTVVADLEEWLKANPQAQWNEVAGLKLVEQCPETNLRQIQKRLAQNFRVATFRTRHSGWELGLGIGELIPISPSEGCNVKVGEHTYPLIGGKKKIYYHSYAVTDAEMTSWFLEHGANPNAQCEVDCTPLSYAVRNARLSVIKLLLNHGGDVQKGQLLQYAVCRDEELEDVISLLIDRGAPLNATMYQDGPTLMRFFPMSLGTALHVATEQEKTNAIRLLIRLGADTGVKDANGDTALEWAQKWNKSEMVKLLGDLEDRS